MDLSTVAIVTASAALPFCAGVQQATAAAHLEQAVALGQAMMEEVLARPYYEPGVRAPALGPDSGETSRDLFDNIDDFHGYSEQTVGLRDYRNQAINEAECAGFWRDVTITYMTYAGQQTSDTNSFVGIRVRVFDGTECMVTLNRIATRED